MASLIVETATTMPPADRGLLKDRIVDSIARAIKNIQLYRSKALDATRDESGQVGGVGFMADLNSDPEGSGGIVLTNADWQFHRLVDHLDHALLHGLKSVTKGYWVVVQEFTHASTIKDINTLQLVTTNLGKGRAWLYAALVDCLVECYMQEFSRCSVHVRRFYANDALVLDTERLHQLVTLTSGLTLVSFRLDMDLPYLDLYSYDQAAAQQGAVGGRGVREESEEEGQGGGGERDNLSVCSISSFCSEQSSVSEVQSPVEVSQSASFSSQLSFIDSLRSLGRSLSQRFETVDGTPPTLTPALGGSRLHSLTQSTGRDENLGVVVIAEEVDAEISESGGVCVSGGVEGLYKGGVGGKLAESLGKSHWLRNLSGGSSPGAGGHDDGQQGTLFGGEGVIGRGEEPLEVISMKTKRRTKGPSASIRSLSSSAKSSSAKSSSAKSSSAKSFSAESSSAKSSSDDTSTHSVDEAIKQQVITPESGYRSVVDDSDHWQPATPTRQPATPIRHPAESNRTSETNGSVGITEAAASTMLNRQIAGTSEIADPAEGIADQIVPAAAGLGSMASDSTLCHRDEPAMDSRLGVEAGFSHRQSSDSDLIWDSVVEGADGRLSTTLHSAQHDRSELLMNVGLANETSLSLNGDGLRVDLSNASSVPSADIYNFGLTEVTSINRPEVDISTDLDPIAEDLNKTKILPRTVDSEIFGSHQPTVNTCEGDSSGALDQVSSDLTDRGADPITASMEGSSIYDDLPKFLKSIKHRAARNSPVLSEQNSSLGDAAVVGSQSGEEALNRGQSEEQDAAQSGVQSVKDVVDSGEGSEGGEGAVTSDGTRCQQSQHPAEELVDTNLHLELMLEVFKFEEEQLHKLFSVCVGHTEGEPRPLHVLFTTHALYLLTTHALYLLAPSHPHRFHSVAVLPYKQLDYVSLSLNAQVLTLVCTDRRKQISLTTGEELLTRCLVSELEAAMRGSFLELPPLPLLSDATTQKIATKKWAAKECRLETHNVELLCCSLIHWEDEGAVSSPHLRLPLAKEGTLHYKRPEAYSYAFGGGVWTESMLATSSWVPGYFTLRDGILSMFDDKDSQRTAQMSIAITDLILYDLFLLDCLDRHSSDRSANCQGCRASPERERKHSFELLLANGSQLLLSATSNTEATDWVHCLCLAMADNAPGVGVSEFCLACCLTLTQTLLLTYHEELQSHFMRTLGVGHLASLRAVQLDRDAPSYCVLRYGGVTVGGVERQERWALYFNSAPERDRFLAALHQAYSTLMRKSLEVGMVDDSLSKRCRCGASKIRAALAPIITSV